MCFFFCNWLFFNWRKTVIIFWIITSSSKGHEISYPDFISFSLHFLSRLLALLYLSSGNCLALCLVAAVVDEAPLGASASNIIVVGFVSTKTSRSLGRYMKYGWERERKEVLWEKQSNVLQEKNQLCPWRNWGGSYSPRLAIATEIEA